MRSTPPVKAQAIREACEPLFERLRTRPAHLRIREAAQLSDELVRLHVEIGEIRRSAVRELRAEGWTLVRIARKVGVTIARVRQIEHGNPRPVRTDRRPPGRPPNPPPPEFDPFIGETG